jgi:polyisoprenoid-binding protein YceI
VGTSQDQRGVHRPAGRDRSCGRCRDGPHRRGTGSIDTKNAKRDTHLRSDDLLATDTFPHLIFVLDSVGPSPTAIQANDTLTVRDQTRPIVFETTVSAAGDSEITVTSELDVDRGDYDVTWNQLGMARMNNSVSIKAVFTRA